MAVSSNSKSSSRVSRMVDRAGKPLLLWLLAAAQSVPCAGRAASPTVDPDAQVGRTSYQTFPMASAIWHNSWGSTNGLAPMNLFWRAGDFYTNAASVAAAHVAAAQDAAKGIVPIGVAQRWEGTFAAAQPASAFADAPGWVATVRANGAGPALPDIPEFRAWVAWTQARPSLLARAGDGGSMPPYYRAWHGTWGQISPMMPLQASDCPPGMAACTYGDWYADQWAQTARLSGATGIELADFANGLPSQPSWLQDFNPAIVARFSRQSGRSVPAGSAAAKSAYITAHLMPEWNDFLAAGYADFFAALATRIGAATGQPALVVAGGQDDAAMARFYAIDTRIMAAKPGLLDHLVVIWDGMTMQPDRDGASVDWGIGGSVIAAAREPLVRNGAFLSADAPNFWAAVAKFHPTLSAAEQREWGERQLKREWLDYAWAHVANTDGTVRRALAFASRDHWDAGALDPALLAAIQSIYPVRPFGFALYYSASIERAVEADPGIAKGRRKPYLDAADLLAFRQQVPLNYYVSDRALPNLQRAAAPAAWIVLDAGDRLPAAERARLQSIAPVFTTASAALHFAGAPLSFTGGLTGTSFYDQHGRLIVTVTNPATAPGAGDIAGAMTLRGLADGAYTMRDLLTNAAASFNVAHGAATVPLTVSRWDTLALAITPIP